MASLSKKNCVGLNGFFWGGFWPLGLNAVKFPLWCLEAPGGLTWVAGRCWRRSQTLGMTRGGVIPADPPDLDDEVAKWT